MAEANAANLPTVPVTGGIQDILALFSAIAPTLGTGKTTGTATETIDPATSAQMDALLQSVLGGNNSAYLDEMVGNILERAKQSFAPVIGQSISSGARAYSDTTLKQLGNEAMARATAEAAAAKLEAINRNNQVAASILNTKAANSSTITSTQQTGMSPAGQLLQYAGLGLTGYSLYNKYLAPKKPGTGTTAAAASGPGAINQVAPGQILNPDGSITNPDGISQFDYSFDGADLSGAAPGTEVSAAISSLEGGSGAVTLDPSALFNISTPEASLASLATPSDLAIGGGLDLLSGGDTLTLVDDLGGATASSVDLSGFGLDLVDDVGVDAAGSFVESGFADAIPYLGSAINVAQGDYGAAAGAAIGTAIFPGVGTAIGGFVGGLFDDDGGSVICSHSYASGMIPRAYYVTNARYGKSLPRETMRGYHFWGKPFVKLMKKYKWIAKLGNAMAISHAKYVNGEITILGWTMNQVVRRICTVIGKCLGGR